MKNPCGHVPAVLAAAHSSQGVFRNASQVHRSLSNQKFLSVLNSKPYKAGAECMSLLINFIK